MKLQALVITVGLAVILAGCKTPEGAYVAVANPASPEAVGVPVALLNYDLTRTLAVDRPPAVDRDSTGRLRIQVGLRNRTDQERLQIQVQTVWMNDAGRVLYSDTGSEAAWQTLSISPNQSLYYSQTALTDEATRFTVRVRYTAPAR
ncbi:MAG TPA: hypothetical protein VMV72_17695 [Verrucomicrobiae bacterium]|nr:hypothetical protein [Verrucomicrobiae bacterium]